MEFFDGLSTPIGRLHIVVLGGAVVRLFLPNERWRRRFVRAPKHPLIVRAKKELKEYFAGRRRTFTVPVRVHGTAFEMKAWRTLRRIPYGATISYAEEARRMGLPRATRAAGRANGKNPIPVIIPCHRVLRKGGKLGGYAGGLACKKKLLALEQKSV